MSEDTAHYPPQSPLATGMAGRCPRCGEGKLFSGYLTLAKRCSVCGLDFSFADSADGPAVFVMLIVGFVIAGAALMVELAFSPPIWLHVVLWGPLILILSLGMLRPIKGFLVCAQYINRAKEGEIDRDTP